MTSPRTDANKPDEGQVEPSECCELLEQWFDDSEIQEQTAALIKDKDGQLSVGVSLVIRDMEVLLEYAELKAAIEYLEKDRAAHRAMGHKVL